MNMTYNYSTTIRVVKSSPYENKKWETVIIKSRKYVSLLQSQKVNTANIKWLTV